VGCTNPDLSHFKSIDIWHSGSDAASIPATGWLGRFIEEENQQQENQTGDPPAIQIGFSTLSNIFQGANANMGMAVQNTNAFYDLKPGHYDTAPATLAGNKMDFFRHSVIESKAYWSRVKAAAAAQKNLSDKYPEQGKNPLADQLKIAAQLIGGGLKTKIYKVSLRGFDTHDRQVDSADSTKGDHAILLAQVSEAITAFQDDIQLMGKTDSVLGMTYSEFGRRIKSNASYGCDHGTAAPLILFGTKLKAGLIGKNPEIAPKVDVNDNLPMQYDFRSVYASVLQGWFGVSSEMVNATMFGKYPVLDLFQA
jgi:uncharacterized protein (DUF1501 family)